LTCGENVENAFPFSVVSIQARFNFLKVMLEGSNYDPLINESNAEEQ
jgi:hypothetical protein